MSHNNKHTGYVSVYRSILNWQWYQNHAATRLFIHLILLANHKPTKWKNIEIQRGQVVTSIKSLQTQTTLSENQIRYSIFILKSTNDITIKTTNKFSIITVNNYGSYQFNENKINKQINKQISTQITNKPQQTISKEVNNIYIVEQARPIIDHLNERAKTTFKPDTTITCKLIGKLLKRGYTQKDFEDVHNKKIEQWTNDEKMRKFIRPQTLYAESNFEAYLNEKPATTVSRIAKL